MWSLDRPRAHMDVEGGGLSLQIPMTRHCLVNGFAGASDYGMARTTSSEYVLFSPQSLLQLPRDSRIARNRHSSPCTSFPEIRSELKQS